MLLINITEETGRISGIEGEKRCRMGEIVSQDSLDSLVYLSIVLSNFF